MDTNKIKAFLVKPVYKKVKVWHIGVAILVLVAATGKDKKGSSSSNYDDTCCCAYYEAARTGRPSSDVIIEQMDFEECMRLSGMCQQDKSKCY